ncbi:hypothetical protein F5880DRAFT_1618567 [Lentinula raphanica]|nr:hypothetical protein F5880DRAFT_1618567 [Lentinula raphanica]
MFAGTNNAESPAPVPASESPSGCPLQRVPEIYDLAFPSGDQSRADVEFMPDSCFHIGLIEKAPRAVSAASLESQLQHMQITVNSPADSKPVPDSDTAVQPQKRGGKDRWMCYSCCVGCFLCFSRCFGTCGRKRVPRNRLNERGQETNAQLDLEHGLNGGGVQSDMDPGSNMRGSKLSLDKKDGLNEYEAPESPPPAYTKKDVP